MKNGIFKKITTFFCLILCLTIGFSLLSFYSAVETLAENETPSFSQKVVSDENFTLTMKATARNESQSLPLVEETYHTIDGDITYLCFQWRDLNNLTFSVTNTFDSDLTFYSYSLYVTNAITDDLTQSILSEDYLPEEILFSDFLTNSSLNYYIDSDANAGSVEAKKGYGFGLYRFQFVYKFTDSRQPTSKPIERPFDESIYVAVIPDDIDKISEIDIQLANIQILHSVSSANNLMDSYNLWLSSDLFKYVNPRYIKWEIVGTDKDNNIYVLTEDMQEEYPNSKVLYETPDYPPYGNSYYFDSNSVEGTWNVECKILWKNPPEGVAKNEARYSFTVTGLSTYKIVPKSNLWWILLLILLIFILIILIIIIVLVRNKKKEKIW